MTQASKAPVTLDVDALRELAQACFTHHGVENDTAHLVADVLVDADMRGVPSHGTTRVEAYLQRVENGVLDPAGRPRIERETGGSILMDGGNGFGAVAGMDAARLAVDRVADAGVVWIAVRGTNHLGPLGYYTQWLATRGIASFLFCNAAPTVAGWGGIRPAYGTNPFSVGVPGGERDICLDMATTQVAKGKIRRAAAEDRPIPEGLAFDRSGRPTTDAAEALVGTLAPMGGYKGYGLAMIIDMLTGVLVDGAIGPDVKSAADPNGLSGASFTLIATAVEHYGDQDAFRKRVDIQSDWIRASGDPEHDVKLPGEPEARNKAEARENGVSIGADVHANLLRLAGRSAA